MTEQKFCKNLQLIGNSHSVAQTFRNVSPYLDLHIQLKQLSMYWYGTICNFLGWIIYSRYFRMPFYLHKVIYPPLPVMMQHNRIISPIGMWIKRLMLQVFPNVVMIAVISCWTKQLSSKKKWRLKQGLNRHLLLNLVAALP